MSLNFNKNKLINKTLTKYYETFQVTLDTEDYISPKYNKKIDKYIFKNLKKALKRIDKEDNFYQRNFNKKLRLEKKCKKRILKLDLKEYKKLTKEEIRRRTPKKQNCLINKLNLKIKCLFNRIKELISNRKSNVKAK